MTLDLFMWRINAQLPSFASWRQDPNSIVVDAFQLPWVNEIGYAFPLFCQISRGLAKTLKKRVTLVLVCPAWQAQPWYAQLLEMAIAPPVLLLQYVDLLRFPLDDRHELLVNQRLILTPWKVSGNKVLQTDYRKELPHF